MKKKKCGKCKKYKPLSEFHKGNCKGGLSSYCKRCDTLNRRKYDMSEYQKFYRQQHKKELKEKRIWSRYPARIKLKKLGLSENFTATEWKNKVEKTSGICFNCGRLYCDGDGLTINHIPDMSKAPKGFVYTIDDVEPLCMSCNVSLFASTNIKFKKTKKPRSSHVYEKLNNENNSIHNIEKVAKFIHL